MKSILLTPERQELKRVAEILLIMMVLLVIFSIGGMPMILLSTFSPSSIQWDVEQNDSEQLAIEVSSEAA
jgi:flagellar basal body-associated protein FliL